MATDLLPAYLAVGPDELKRNKMVERLKKRLDESFSAFNLDEFTGSTVDIDVLVSALQTMPMGDSRRIVILREADKLSKAASEVVILYLENPNPTTTLLLTAQTLARTTRLYKAVAKIGAKSVVLCASMKPRELAPYVQKLAASYGLAIDFSAAQELVDRVGDSTTMLDAQVKTLAALSDGQPITTSFVEQHIARVAEVKPWTFLDSLSARNLRRSLELYEILPDKNALGLLTLITTRVRELICAASLKSRGEAAHLATELKKQDWQVREYVKWASVFKPGELERLLFACACCERGLKSGADEKTVMLKLIMQMCGNKYKV